MSASMTSFVSSFKERAHAMARRLSLVCLCVCPCVCKLFCGNRYYDAKNNSIATKLAQDGHHMGAHPCCAQGRGQGQRSRDTSAFVPITKIASCRRQIARLRPNLHTMVPRCACIQGVLKVKVKVKGHMLGAVLCWHENASPPREMVGLRPNLHTMVFRSVCI